jgi:hypothetical protein
MTKDERFDGNFKSEIYFKNFQKAAKREKKISSKNEKLTHKD